MTQLDSRFYDDGREYTARDWGQVFQYLAGDGVMPGEGLEFQITQNNPLSMVVHIDTGVCFIEGRYGRLEEPTNKTVADSNESFDRIDRVIIRMDQINGMDIYIKRGNASSVPSPPDLMRSEAIYEISIAQIYVSAGVNIIEQKDITYEKNNYEVCGHALPFSYLINKRIMQEPRREEFIRNGENYIIRIENYVGDKRIYEEVYNRSDNNNISYIDRNAYDPTGEHLVLTSREYVNRNSNGYITGTSNS
ncbi:hypothetical protein [Geomicrobium sp. JCM 19038]|uniref:hypothetical protein n=1 Tax=Geomicrobium sp. JCM 19038 TaxID=1460635 RepID=UPI00045F346E|nr:hypothetical protein [Geomicrobium sp. JCM 19038]GAK09633.1 structural protein [Geomicrobium sp. JCM 19038]